MKRRILSVILAFAVFAGNTTGVRAGGNYETTIEIMDETKLSSDGLTAEQVDSDDDAGGEFLQGEIAGISAADAGLADGDDDIQIEIMDEADLSDEGDSSAEEEITIISLEDDEGEAAEDSSASFSSSSQESLYIESGKLEKAELPVDQMWNTFRDLKEGEDYAKDELMSLADSEKEAEAIAAAYDGELKSFEYGVAIINLEQSRYSVEDAFKLALDTNLDYPMAEPNYIIAFEETPEDESAEFSAEIPMLRKSAWEVQYYENGHDDPFLNPSNSRYQWFHDVLETYGAWGATTGRSDIVVAVIDSGVDYQHVDLEKNILDVSSEIDLNDNMNMDMIGHGTHVAGLIAAQIDNNSGGGGVAPGVRIMPIAVNDGRGGASIDYMTKAVNYVAGVETDGDRVTFGKRRADIINMSISTKIFVAAFQEATEHAYEAGVTVVSAMGNSSANVIVYPAYFDHVIAVAATDQSGNIAYFSDVGTWADIKAPGVDIVSTYWNRFNPDIHNLYAAMSGTSMSSPIVAGVCALYMSAFGHVDPDTMERVLKSCAVNGIANITKMLDTDSTPPAIGLHANDPDAKGNLTLLGTVSDGKTYTLPYNVAADSILSFGAMNYSEETADSTNNKIIYTTDGQTPTVENGEVKYGTIYDGKPITVSKLCGIMTGNTKLTIKARTVTGTGVISKVTTLSFTVDPTMQIGTVDEGLEKDLSVTITRAPRQMVAGKTVILNAEVSPVTSKIQTTWKIISYRDGDLSKAQITSDGTLTTNANQHGILTVGCYSTDGRVYDSVDIEVISTIYPVKTLKIPSKVEMKFDPTKDDGGSAKKTIKISKLIDTKDNNILGQGLVSFEWTSSDTKVVEVSTKDINATKATIVAKGAGTATIKCKALDGSNISASCTVKVTSEKIVKSVIVVPKSESEDYDITYNSNGSLKQVDVSVNPVITVTAIQSGADGVLANVSDPSWSCSDKKILSLEPSGKSVKITGLSKGSAIVKCMASDGSGKSSEFIVKVKKVVTDIELSGQYYIAPGASATYKASILPSDANDKSVTWSVVNAKNKKAVRGVKISTSGKVTVDKTVKTGTMLLIKAVANDKGHVNATFTAEVLTKATKVTIVSPGKNADLYLGATSKAREGYGDSIKIVAKADNYTALTFTSTNPKTLVLSDYVFDTETGENTVTVTGVKKGSGTIKVKTMDGSDMGASTDIKVKQLVTGITITGQDYIAKGKQTTYKATSSNSDADVKSVTWVISGNPQGITVNPKNGEVKVAKDAAKGTYKIIATATDGSGISKSKKFTVTETKAESVKLATDDTYSERTIYKVNRDKSGKLVSFQLTDVDIDGAEDDDERNLRLEAQITGSSASIVTWKSSNTKVAKVSALGLVTAVSKGSATITGTVNDGSGKSASVKVNVITPAAGIDVTIADQQLSPIGYGKSIKVKASLENTYGNPSIKTIEWDPQIVALTSNSYVEFDEAISAELKKKKAFFTYSDGKVTANSKKDFDKYYEIYKPYLDAVGGTGFGMLIMAYTTDGTGYGSGKVISATDPTTRLELYTYSPVPDDAKKITGDTISLDGYSLNGTQIYYSWDQFYYRYTIESDGTKKFIVNSDKPEVASAYCNESTGSVFYVHPRKKGTAEITIKTQDGSGKTIKIKFTVIETAPQTK